MHGIGGWDNTPSLHSQHCLIHFGNYTQYVWSFLLKFVRLPSPVFNCLTYNNGKLPSLSPIKHGTSTHIRSGIYLGHFRCCPNRIKSAWDRVCIGFALSIYFSIFTSVFGIEQSLEILVVISSFEFRNQSCVRIYRSAGFPYFVLLVVLSMVAWT